MGIEEIVQSIINIGFPCVAAVYMAYINDKQDERHRQSEKELITALNNNNVALTQLSERVGVKIEGD